AHPARAPARTAAGEPRPARPAARRSARKRGLGRFLVLLAALMAAAAITLALISSGDGGGGGIAPVDQGDVQQQVDELKQFLREHGR
ncbi:MAG: hypothetical protein H0V50_05870, partial [Thermoleophilaceae bacterium]|nr:hypothetical protein [Thermoleophilaceae bacterium]